MRKRRRFLGLIVLAWGGFVALPAHGLVLMPWKSTCQQPLNCVFSFCWCEGDWNTASNWSGAGNPPQVPPPNLSSEYPFIGKNHAVNAAFNNCDHWSTSCGESFLQVNLATVTAGELWVEALSSGYEMYLALWGNEVLSVSEVQIRGQDGRVVVEVGGLGLVQTY